ncbi:MAG: hypothetical protein KJ052_09600 [Candidatus Hydrogenedentes bacterium]|nr:hypothetical protein [Candidatus Hydrogenedentota bacterium]
MSPAKRFLLIFFIVYIGISFAWYSMYGPAGLTHEYLEAHFDRHEHYFEILHSDHFKEYLELRHLYRETPVEVYPRTDNDSLNNQIAFVEAYEQFPDYVAEQARIAKFHYFFEFFSAAGGILIALRFGRKPLLSFLDSQIALVQGRIERAATEQQGAAAAKSAAQAKVASLAHEKAEIAKQTDDLIKRTEADAQEAMEQLTAQIAQERAMREMAEHQRAAMQIKKELVEAAVRSVREQFKTDATENDHRLLVNDFVQAVDSLQ